MKTLWGIRHLRWLWHTWRFERYLSECAEMGLGGLPQPSDLAYLEAIWKGER